MDRMTIRARNGIRANMKNNAGGRAGIGTALAVLAALLAVLTLSTCENALTAVIAQDEEYSATLLQASSTPSTSNWIAGNETIVIRFADPVDTATLVMSGTLGITESDTGYLAWSDTTYSNDTLTLTPPLLTGHASFYLWPEGSGMTLVISAESTNGKVMDARTFAFDVEYRYCVDDDAGGSGNGSRLAPLDTVQGGIDAAAALYVEFPASEIPVRVAVGTYSADCQYDSTYTAGEEHWVAFMRPGVSLHGGYDSTFLALHGSQKTIFSDSATAGGGSSFETSASVLYIGSDITETQVIENLTIKPAVSSGDDGSVCGIHIFGSSPELRNITVTGAASGGPDFVWGMFIEGASASPDISNPAVDPGAATQISAGLYVNSDANPSVTGTNPADHFIKSGSGSSAFAIYYYEASGTFNGIGIYGPNTSVQGLSGFTSADVDGGCVCLWYYADPSFEGNTFYQDYTIDQANNGNQLFICYEGTSSQPVAFRENDYAFIDGYYYNLQWYHDNDLDVSVNSGNYETQNITTGEGSGLLMSPSVHDNYSSTAVINYP